MLPSAGVFNTVILQIDILNHSVTVEITEIHTVKMETVEQK